MRVGSRRLGVGGRSGADVGAGDVVVELVAEAYGVLVIVVLAGAGLVGVAGVKGVGLAVNAVGVAAPDAIAAAGPGGGGVGELHGPSGGWGGERGLEGRGRSRQILERSEVGRWVVQDVQQRVHDVGGSCAPAGRGVGEEIATGGHIPRDAAAGVNAGGDDVGQGVDGGAGNGVAGGYRSSGRGARNGVGKDRGQSEAGDKACGVGVRRTVADGCGAGDVWSERGDGSDGGDLVGKDALRAGEGVAGAQGYEDIAGGVVGIAGEAGVSAAGEHIDLRIRYGTRVLAGEDEVAAAVRSDGDAVIQDGRGGRAVAACAHLVELNGGACDRLLAAHDFAAEAELLGGGSRGGQMAAPAEQDEGEKNAWTARFCLDPENHGPTSKGMYLAVAHLLIDLGRGAHQKSFNRCHH